MKFFVTTAKGLEGLLLEELRGFGFDSAKESVAGVAIDEDVLALITIGIWSRFAHRVMMPLAEAKIASVDDFYDLVRTAQIKHWLGDAKRMVVDVSGKHRLFNNTQFAAQKAKDAIVDVYRYAGLERPSVDLRDPEVRIFVRLSEKKVTVGIDCFGFSLHRRGHRLAQGEAPLKETVAAALLVRAGFNGGANIDTVIDPFCGSGTLLLEALDMAYQRAPGLGRAQGSLAVCPFELGDSWSIEQSRAKMLFEENLKEAKIRVIGTDGSYRSVEIAEENLAHSGYVQAHIEQKTIEQWLEASPTEDRVLVVANPPYGHRLGVTDELKSVYGALGQVMETVWKNGVGAVITSEAVLGRSIGIEADRKYKLYNGQIPCELYVFKRLGADPRKARAEKPMELSEGGVSFHNRLLKNLKRLKKWAKREGVECYRLYDADIPEYNVAIDLYADTFFLQEYAAPKTVDEALANRRFKEIKHVLSLESELAPKGVKIRRRQRQKGTQQYEKLRTTGNRKQVNEGGLHFWVNLDDYLDTGLFLDHRPLRSWVLQNALKKRVLNLFCYTGSISVYAAKGGATSVVSLDLSQTYLDWAQANFQLNDLDPAAYVFLRADCTAWLASAKGQYDLIILDPPSFSNSKRMEDTLDVQRDHAVMVEQCMGLLSDEGQLIFSTNRKGFKLDEQVQAKYAVEDWSMQTIPEDFKRKSNAHRCWRIAAKN